METSEELESGVRYYSRRWPAVFTRAKGSHLFAEDGSRYLDFFMGAGSLNYGHNTPELTGAVVEYLRGNGVLNSLDLATVAKRDFIRAFDAIVLRPRGMTYRVQFTGPSGTDAVEAALRLARKVTGRRRVISLSGAFHGMTLGSRQVCGQPGTREFEPGAATLVPHELDVPEPTRAAQALATAFSEPGGPPAALIVETVQGEGGVRPCSDRYLQAAESLCRRHGALLIVDDIQAGCGRTGPFFSFEGAGVTPDIVCLSKSLSAIGLPLSMLLLNPRMDVWEPGEHSGTFRGNNLAFVAGRTALRRWWLDGELAARTERRSAALAKGLSEIAGQAGWAGPVRARGLMLGLPCSDATTADQVSALAFQRGLLVETCGLNGEVVKLLPPLTVAEEEIEQALQILRWALGAATPAADGHARSMACARGWSERPVAALQARGGMPALHEDGGVPP